MYIYIQTTFYDYVHPLVNYTSSLTMDSRQRPYMLSVKTTTTSKDQTLRRYSFIIDHPNCMSICSESKGRLPIRNNIPSRNAGAQHSQGLGLFTLSSRKGVSVSSSRSEAPILATCRLQGHAAARGLPVTGRFHAGIVCSLQGRAQASTTRVFQE